MYGGGGSVICNVGNERWIFNEMQRGCLVASTDIFSILVVMTTYTRVTVVYHMLGRHINTITKIKMT
jgi:hypothetical protein